MPERPLIQQLDDHDRRRILGARQGDRRAQFRKLAETAGVHQVEIFGDECTRHRFLFLENLATNKSGIELKIDTRRIGRIS